MRKVAIAAVLAVMASLLGVVAAMPAIATHVAPVTVAGNPTCGELTPGTIELKVDPGAPGVFTDGTLTVTIVTHTTAAGPTFDWSATFAGDVSVGLDSVFAKGGPLGGNLYSYNPEEDADTGLHAPATPGGTWAGLSHISFCYDLEAKIKVNKTIPNVVTGTEEITITFVAVLAGGDPVTDPKGTCSITFTAGQTDKSCTIIGLDPNTSYDIYETVTGGFDAQPSQTISTGAGGSTTEVSFVNTFDNATATAQKVTVPSTVSAGGWTFNLFLDNDGTPGKSIGDELVISVVTDSTGLADFGELVKEGDYYITETLPAGWTKVKENCTFSVDYPGNAGDVFDDCVITNTQQGRVQLTKTVAGQTSADSFNFELRTGVNINNPNDPNDDTPGITLFTLAVLANATPQQIGGFFNAGDVVTVCEVLPGPGWTSTLGSNLGLTQYILVVGDSNERVCVDITVGAGVLTDAQVDNTPASGGAELTIGFWKNHASCKLSNGNQDPVLDETLATFAGGGFLTGDLFVNTCFEARSLLDKRTVNAAQTKKASDPAFNLAAQYVAAKLNVQGGGGTCANATIAAAQTLLDTLNFNGVTVTYASGAAGAAQKTLANQYAATLDAYNNGLSC